RRTARRCPCQARACSRSASNWPCGHATATMRGTASALEYRLEAAPDHPLAVEGHVHVRHGGVVLHLFPGGVGGRLVRPDEPGEDHLLAVLELDRALEVGGLTV